MMESLNGFIITLATIIIFISAVELIFPDNSFKKYQSFVLGLIVLSVILTPIVKFFSSGEDIGQRVKSALEEIEQDSESENIYNGEKNGDYVITTLNNNCKKVLEEHFEDKDFTVNIDGEIDFTSYKTIIRLVTVNARNKGEFEPIIVGQNEIIEIKENDFTNEVKEYLGNELKIDKKLIRVIEK